MIILPDKNIPRSKFLIPMRNSEWMSSSQAMPKNRFGKQNTTVFRVRGRLNDGYCVWQGIFEDRNDFDAFLYSTVAGSLRYERELWKLPVPEWNPDLPENISYDFATVTFLQVPGSNTYSKPIDWSDINNSIEGIGAGGGGSAWATGGSAGGRASGGGGGEYRRINNFSFGVSSSVNYVVGLGGGATDTGGGAASVSFSGSGAGAGEAGNTGSATTFNTTSLIANPGAGGQISYSSNVAGGAGGSGGTGTVGFNGGNGGSVNTTYGAAGGGGAGGQNGAGLNGQNGVNSSDNITTNGGAGNANTNGGGYGGPAGNTSAAARSGGGGTNFQVSPAFGSGGGGAGDVGNISASIDDNGRAGSGGADGAGGGAAVTINISSSGTSEIAVAGMGSDGLLVITYEPLGALGVNIAMGGL